MRELRDGGGGVARCAAEDAIVEAAVVVRRLGRGGVGLLVAHWFRAEVLLLLALGEEGDQD